MFKNGTLDEQFAYQKLAGKQNIHCEITFGKAYITTLSEGCGAVR